MAAGVLDLSELCASQSRVKWKECLRGEDVVVDAGRSVDSGSDWIWVGEGEQGCAM